MFEGLFLGSLSAAFATMMDGIIVQAVGLTFGTLFTMLVIYKTGLIPVTEKLKSGIVMATGAVFVVYLFSFVGSFFGMTVPYPVSYTHLDVYKRQRLLLMVTGSSMICPTHSVWVPLPCGLINTLKKLTGAPFLTEPVKSPDVKGFASKKGA